MTVVTGTYLPVVVGAAVIRDHVLRLLFDDGTVGDVDFSAEEWKGVLQPLGDPKYFARVRVDPNRGASPGPTAKTWPLSRCTSRLERIRLSLPEEGETIEDREFVQLQK
jgi:hypothetical protein